MKCVRVTVYSIALCGITREERFVFYWVCIRVRFVRLGRKLYEGLINNTSSIKGNDRRIRQSLCRNCFGKKNRYDKSKVMFCCGCNVDCRCEDISVGRKFAVGQTLYKCYSRCIWTCVCWFCSLYFASCYCRRNLLWYHAVENFIIHFAIKDILF